MFAFSPFLQLIKPALATRSGLAARSATRRPASAPARSSTWVATAASARTASATWRPAAGGATATRKGPPPAPATRTRGSARAGRGSRDSPATGAGRTTTGSPTRDARVRGESLEKATTYSAKKADFPFLARVQLPPERFQKIPMHPLHGKVRLPSQGGREGVQQVPGGFYSFVLIRNPTGL